VTDAAWWARVQDRMNPDDALPRRVWTLRKGEHEAAMELRAVPGIGAEVVLSVDSEMWRTRLYRAHQRAELSRRSRTRGRA
jgi:hypothetical protein